MRGEVTGLLSTFVILRKMVRMDNGVGRVSGIGIAPCYKKRSPEVHVIASPVRKLVSTV